MKRRTIHQTERAEHLYRTRITGDDLPVVARRAEDSAANRGTSGVTCVG